MGSQDKGNTEKILVFLMSDRKQTAILKPKGGKKGNFQISKSLEHPYKGAKKQSQLFHTRSDQIILVLTVVIPRMPDLGLKPLIITYKWSVAHLTLWIPLLKPIPDFLEFWYWTISFLSSFAKYLTIIRNWKNLHLLHTMRHLFVQYH